MQHVKMLSKTSNNGVSSFVEGRRLIQEAKVVEKRSYGKGFECRRVGWEQQEREEEETAMEEVGRHAVGHWEEGKEPTRGGSDPLDRRGWLHSRLTRRKRVGRMGKTRKVRMEEKKCVSGDVCMGLFQKRVSKKEKQKTKAKSHNTYLDCVRLRNNSVHSNRNPSRLL